MLSAVGRHAIIRGTSRRASQWGAASATPRLGAPQHSRRQLLSTTVGGLLLGGNNRQQARPATAVYQEIQVVLPDNDDSAGPQEPPPTYVKATGRIIAIGDLHGDMPKTVRCLKMAGVAEVEEASGELRWTGGDAVIVQLGDVLDRGDAEIGIIMLLRKLDEQARQQGGAVYMLNGNHESLNVCGDFRYVTPGAFLESAEWFGMPRDVAARNWDGCIQARAALYLPGGKIARELARNPTVLVVNETAFAHGGLLPAHTAYGIERMNAEVAAWMRREKASDGQGYAAPPFVAMGDGHSVMWNRTLSKEFYSSTSDRYHACNSVTQALRKIGAKRLVVGHTPQMRGVNCECDGKVWRVDVGMSSGVLDAPAGFLEISAPGSAGETQCRIVTDDIRGLSDDESDVDQVAWSQVA